MAIPDYQTVMLPLLKYLSDGSEHGLADSVQALADEFALSPEERQKLLPSGAGLVIRNRVGWARTYLKKAGLLDQTRRGFFKIAPRGLQVVKENPPRIDVKFLLQFKEFQEFRELRREKDSPIHESDDEAKSTPEEALESAYQRMRLSLEAEVIERTMATSPGFFEKLVVEVLVRMGYGGSLHDAGEAVGKSGDGGIDGIIKEDRLGLDVIYIQAKRWEGTVGRPEVQKFAGALQGHRAKKGVLITTSSFTKEALDFVKAIDSRIVLVDGLQLARLMIDHNVGVSPVRAFELKRVDSDYFAED